MMFSVLGRLGMDTNLVKHFALDHAVNRWDRILEVYQKTLMVVIPTGIILSAILYFSSGYLAEFVFKKPSLASWFKIISFGVLPMILRFVNSECYRGFRMNEHYAFSQNVSYFIYASVLLGIFSTFSTNEFLPNIAFVISLLLLAISSSFLILKRINKYTQQASSEFQIPEMVKNSAPMMMASSMMLVSGWINIILLGIWASESDVGILSVILKIATFATFMLMSINSVATPRFAVFFGNNDLEGLRKYTAQTAKIIFYTSIPIFAGIVVFNEWLLGLFGDEFKIGSMALLITMLGQLFNVFAGSVGSILNMTGHQSVFRNIILISTAINVIVCILLIPAYGLLGSAIAGAVFMACWNIASVIYIKRKLNINTFYNPF